MENLSWENKLKHFKLYLWTSLNTNYFTTIMEKTYFILLKKRRVACYIVKNKHYSSIIQVNERYYRRIIVKEELTTKVMLFLIYCISF